MTSWRVHVLGFVYGKQEEMPARVIVPSSCYRARGTRCVLQEDSSENDEVFKSTLVCQCGKIFVQLQTCTLFHKLAIFFPYIPSCEAHEHKQFEAEPAQYGLEINFNTTITHSKYLCLRIVFLSFSLSFSWRCAAFLHWSPLTATNWFGSCCARLLCPWFSSSPASCRLLRGGFRGRFGCRRCLLWRHFGLNIPFRRCGRKQCSIHIFATTTTTLAPWLPCWMLSLVPSTLRS